MALIDQIQIRDQQFNEITKQKESLEVKDRIKTRSNRLALNMRATVLQLMSDVWNNPILTPQEVFDALDDDDAAELVELGAALKPIINSVFPNAIPSTPAELTINEDRTVTVGAPIAQG